MVETECYNNREDFVLLEINHPEKAIAIIEKWSKEHPKKTRADDFYEKFPKAHKTSHGTPYTCAYRLGYLKDRSCCNNKCVECWNTPLDE